MSGIAINTLCVSFIGVLSYVSEDQQLRSLTLWMMGSLSQNNGAILAIASSIISLTMFMVLQQSMKLNLLQLGDEEAYCLGLKVKKQVYPVSTELTFNWLCCSAKWNNWFYWLSRAASN